MGCASSKPEPAQGEAQAQAAPSTGQGYSGSYQQAHPSQQYGVPGFPGGRAHAPMGMPLQQPVNGYNPQQHMSPPGPQSHQREGSAHGNKGGGLLSRLSFRTSNRSVIEGLASVYQVRSVLGSGCEGKTWLCQDINTGHLWACKMVKLPLHTKMVQAIFREIRIQSELGEGHISIITPQEVVLTSHYLGLVMEYAPGGSLTQYVTRKWKETGGVGLLMQEDEALYFFKQLVHAVDYCHKHHVVHRDLKLDNTLLSHHNPPYLKICDFGFARGWGDDSNFNTIIGTPDYMAPELTSAKVHKTEAKYDGCKADVWSLAVLLCVVLLGKFPFDDPGPMQDAMRSVYKQQHAFERWRDNPILKDGVALLSSSCVDLLDSMFAKNEADRISIADVRKHPWFTRPLPPYYQAPLDALFREQDALERHMASGINKSKERDAAIANLIRMACGDEFKKQAVAAITPEFTFQLYMRINLRTVQDSYPVFNRSSVKAMIKAEHRRTSRGPTSVYGPQSGSVHGPASGGMYPQSQGAGGYGGGYGNAAAGGSGYDGVQGGYGPPMGHGGYGLPPPPHVQFRQPGQMGPGPGPHDQYTPNAMYGGPNSSYLQGPGGGISGMGAAPGMGGMGGASGGMNGMGGMGAPGGMGAMGGGAPGGGQRFQPPGAYNGWGGGPVATGPGSFARDDFGGAVQYPHAGGQPQY